MFISMMFAGHHTTSGTAAWTLIELLRHPDELAAVRAELDELYAHGEEVSYQALRAMPRLESAIKEALRLHPPLILVLRVVKEELEVEGFRIAPGKLVGASPAVSNRIAEDFPDPDAFVPERYLEPRAEDRANPWTWIPFGAGRHRCVGAPFAMMQLKAIFSVLLRHWDFELAQPSDTYRNDHSKMVVQLAQPCVAHYRRRGRGGDRVVKVVVDRDLCQGHGVCESEAPAVFTVSKKGVLEVLDESPPEDAAVPGRGGREVLSHPCADGSRRTDVPAFPYEELEEMVQRWLDTNRRAQEAGDWKPMAEMYTEDATYGWNIGPHEEFMAVGRDEIRDIALGLEMGGLDGWTYPYQKVLIDPKQGEVIGLWKQIADTTRPDGSPYVIAGLGGSWFRYAGNWKWSWQRDFFDVGNATSLFIEMIKADALSDGMRRRMERATSGGLLPGHYPLGTGARRPLGLTGPARAIDRARGRRRLLRRRAGRSGWARGPHRQRRWHVRAA